MTDLRLLAFGLATGLFSLAGCGSGADACREVDCSGHGRCLVVASAPVCACDPGYRADGASCALDACASFPCVHGTCRLADGQAHCECEPGYFAELCDACAPGYHPEGLTCQPDSACAQAICVHGVCREEAGQPVCDCQTGYAGAACEVCAEGYHPVGLVCLSDEACDPDPCVHGSCSAVNSVPVCACETGYAGTWCDGCAAGWVPAGLVCLPAEADPCDPNPCDQPHRTVCRVLEDGFACGCDPGYHDQGGTCEQDVICDPATTCSGHGGCSGAGLECLCDEGYQGQHCEACALGYHLEGGACLPDPVDPCDPNPCQDAHRTQCVAEGEDHRCDCDPGYQDWDVDGGCLPDCATAGLACPDGQVCSAASGTAECVAGQRPPVYISFHWHMHQPIYWPYESIVQTEANQRMGFSVYQVHFDRSGPYGSWPRDAVEAGRSLAHLGAQVSISGSLMENLNNLAGAGVWSADWQAPWIEANGWDTAAGNPRLDLVRFGFHHPLMGLIGPADTRMQLAAHALALERNFGRSRSRGLFPPECAFSERMIPALVAEGIEWVLVDNIHFDRAHQCYPWVPESNLAPPNPADQVDTAPTDWIQLNGLWAPSRVAAPWGYRPHWVRYVDPASGQAQRIIAVPAARYEGNEDGRGGFGALQYEAVLSQYEQLNTDPDHPMLVVLHHDGDNYGGGSDSYYHGNFQAFVAWVNSQPERFVATTVQDYLDAFPPASDDVIHVEDGSWAGADNGDPEFLKWNGDPNAEGYSPDRNSWAVLTAAKNRVLTAEAIAPHSSMAAVVDGSGSETDQAWHFLLNAETSCYWYWDFSEGGLWDSHPTRAANMAVQHADLVLASGSDGVGPTIYLPQREPYNPGLGAEPGDFTVWTYVYDVSSQVAVELRWRVDPDGRRDAANEVYAGGDWNQANMPASAGVSLTDPAPIYRAEEYSAVISAEANTLIDYYVRAVDGLGNASRSPLMHVWVGAGGRVKR